MSRDKNLSVVGKYVEQFNKLTGQSIPCANIYQSSGLATHVQKRHPHEVGNLIYVPSILADPDYVGKNPKELDSIELVKTIGDNIMVCVKLDRKESYLYVASVYSISPAKLKNRINSGRLMPYKKG